MGVVRPDYPKGEERGHDYTPLQHAGGASRASRYTKTSQGAIQEKAPQHEPRAPSRKTNTEPVNQEAATVESPFQSQDGENRLPPAPFEGECLNPKLELRRSILQDLNQHKFEILQIELN